MILDTQPTQSKVASDDNLIPLINVVFLMLIFFMVAGHIEATDGVDVTPPASTVDNKAVQHTVKLAVSSDGKVYHKGSVISEDDLKQLIAELHTSLIDGAEFSVQLKADANLSVEHLQDVLLWLKSSGAQQLSLITQSPEQLAR